MDLLPKQGSGWIVRKEYVIWSRNQMKHCNFLKNFQKNEKSIIIKNVYDSCNGNYLNEPQLSIHERILNGYLFHILDHPTF